VAVVVVLLTLFSAVVAGVITVLITGPINLPRGGRPTIIAVVLLLVVAVGLGLAARSLSGSDDTVRPPESTGGTPTPSETTTTPPPTETTAAPVTPTTDPPTTPTTSPSPAPTAHADDLVLYLDDYVRPCGVSGSIHDTGAAQIGGTTYPHTLMQTANGFDDTGIYLGKRATRFLATVGPTDAAQPGHRMLFELKTETGRTLFTSRTLGPGQTQAVDVSVRGVLRIFPVATSVVIRGGQGTAGWGDARVAATEPLTCP
jgi:hypothetical protein